MIGYKLPSLVNVIDKLGRSALHYVALNNTTQCASECMRECNNIDGVDLSGRSALHYAAMQANIAMVSTLIMCKADVNKADAQGIQPLHLATGIRSYVALPCDVQRYPYRSTDYTWSCTCSQECISLLLQHQANVVDTPKHYSPLHLAALQYVCVWWGFVASIGEPHIMTTDGYVVIELITCR
jgi:hypothetical protein